MVVRSWNNYSYVKAPVTRVWHRTDRRMERKPARDTNVLWSAIMSTRCSCFVLCEDSGVQCILFWRLTIFEWLLYKYGKHPVHKIIAVLHQNISIKPMFWVLNKQRFPKITAVNIFSNIFSIFRPNIEKYAFSLVSQNVFDLYVYSGPKIILILFDVNRSTIYEDMFPEILIFALFILK